MSNLPEELDGAGRPADLDMLKRLMSVGLTESEIRRFLSDRNWVVSDAEYKAAKRDVEDHAEEDLRPFLILANMELYRKSMHGRDFKSAQRALKALATLNTE